MKVTIEKVSAGAKGVWTSHIDPQSLLRLANPFRQGGRINVVLLSNPVFDGQNHSLYFDIDSALVLNLGNTSEAILIDSRESAVPQTLPNALPNIQKRSSGDLRFLQELGQLTDPLRKIGELLLAEVRKEFPGELTFHEKSKKFVESPDNFWVVRIQPRAQSFRITIYGNPHEHASSKSIEIKNDMAGYSSFVIDRQAQIPEAISIIRHAKKLKDRR